MIQYKKFTLSNGMRVILHSDNNTPLVCVNMLYCVGAKDENPQKTGFAHLFEHLMFSGSKNFPSFDKLVEENGGESNAFTNNDFTNFYVTMPADKLEIALQLERDRMDNLIISGEKLDVQKSVVTEEYKQRYLNQPYGDVWLLLRELSYTTHPYRWSTIGKDISHIEKASIEDVKSFYDKFYIPQNVILCIAGNIDIDLVQQLCENIFSSVQKGKAQLFSNITARNLPQEPIQTASRAKIVKRQVPQKAVYITFPMVRRMSQEYYVFDMLSDILSLGDSSRLYNTLVKEQNIFTHVNAFISGDEDEGLFVLAGRLKDGVSFEQAKQALWKQINNISTCEITPKEIQKVKNKYEATFDLSLLKAMDRAQSLCYYEYLGNIGLINDEVKNYQAVKIEDIRQIARSTFKEEKSNILYYDTL